MVASLRQVLGEPVVRDLLIDSLRVLTKRQTPPEIIRLKAETFLDDVVGFAEKEQFFDSTPPKNTYWKDTWIQWANGIINHPQLIHLTELYVEEFRKLNITANTVRESLTELARTVVMVTGLLVAGISIELFYS